MKAIYILSNLVFPMILSLVADLCPAQSYQSGSYQEKSDFQWPDGTGMTLEETVEQINIPPWYLTEPGWGLNTKSH